MINAHLVPARICQRMLIIGKLNSEPIRRSPLVANTFSSILLDANTLFTKNADCVSEWVKPFQACFSLLKDKNLLNHVLICSNIKNLLNHVLVCSNIKTFSKIENLLNHVRRLKVDCLLQGFPTKAKTFQCLEWKLPEDLLSHLNLIFPNSYWSESYCASFKTLQPAN